MTVKELFSNFDYFFKEVKIDNMGGTDTSVETFSRNESWDGAADDGALRKYGDRLVLAWEFDNEENVMSIWLD